MDKTLLSLLGGLMVGALAAGAAVYVTLSGDDKGPPALAQGNTSTVTPSAERGAKANDSGDQNKLNAEITELRLELARLRTKNLELGRLAASLKPQEVVANTPPQSADGEDKTSAATVTKIEGEAAQLSAMVLAACDLKDGKQIGELLFKLKALGPAAYPALYKAYAAYDALMVDKDGNRLDWRGRDQVNRTLKLPDLGDLVTGDLYQTIINDASGTIPSALVTSALWNTARNPMMDSETRAETIQTMVTTYAGDPEVAQTALWSLGRGNDEERTKLAITLLDAPTSSAEIRVSAINALPRQLDDAAVQRLEGLQQSGDRTVEDSARYALQRHKPVETGYLVSSVGDNSAAASAGLRKGDIIVSINGKPMNAGSSINGIKGDIPKDGKVMMLVNRGGQIVQQEIGLTDNRFGIDGGTVYKEGDQPPPQEAGNRRGWGGGR